MDRDLIEAALPGYELGPEIGRGGWGVVYRARHRSLDRQAAVKVLPRAFSADTVTRDRFIDEARLGAQLDHPHIVKVLDFVEHEGLWLIVMERLGGGTLWDRFSSQGLMADEVCAIGLGLCAALESAHERNIVHRDIKPENLLFADDGTPRLADFGVAKALNLGLKRTAQGDIVGTPAYMSPEQARGRTLGPQSDVYSVGVLLYEALSGRLPFLETEDPMAMLLKHIDETPQPLTDLAPDVSEGISAVVMRCLSKEPADRYATASQLGVALAEAAGAAFGPRWVHHSGVEFRGGGPIAEALARGSADRSAMRSPSVAMPAVRDHARVGTSIEPSGEGRPQLDDVSGFSQQPMDQGGPAGPSVGRPTVAPSAGSFEDAPSEPTLAVSGAAPQVGQPRPLSVSGAAPEDGRQKRLTLRNVLIGVAALVVILVGTGFILPGGGSDSPDNIAPTETSAVPTVPDTEPAST
ncbi:MAG: serine/threonine-protein kinase, partial [Actinomycetota bacterium]|nr:serine/threonine-protein kinase [Actinomycetota bacterium]